MVFEGCGVTCLLQSCVCFCTAKLLKDYYYDARYPGDNFVIVTVDELREAFEIMLAVVEAVNEWRISHKLEYKYQQSEVTILMMTQNAGKVQSVMAAPFSIKPN